MLFRFSMQRMLDELEPQTLVEESESLQKFYAFVKRNASGIDNAKGKQEIIIRLYDNFFKALFRKWWNSWVLFTLP